jgi:putative oxidoreductase
MTTTANPSHWTVDAGLLAARVGLAALFLLEGTAKIAAYGASQAYMEKFGVPGLLLPAVVALELGGELTLLIGLLTRLAALALSIFCIAAAVLFHNKLADHGQALHFWKDIAIAGGFLALAAAGAGRWSLDELIRRHATVRT